MSSTPLNNKVALVTGASSGMGRAISLALAENGASIVCCDLRAEANPSGYEVDIATTTSDLIVKRGGTSIFQKVDISDLGQVENAFTRAISVGHRNLLSLENTDRCARSLVVSTLSSTAPATGLHFEIS
jgi:NAD(P)-dependent dehydrogenase (short-subunit alcohol dehydrogenase family)